MKVEEVENVIKLYEAILARPSMYFGNSEDYSAVIHFTAGFYSALVATNQSSPTYPNREEIYKMRGWEFTQFGAVNEMKEKGFSNEEIIKELTLIELKVWEAFRNNLKECAE
jgi:hypothetical protein